MEIVSASRLQVGWLNWQPRPDAWTLTVVAKATFNLKRRVCTLADRQEAISDKDVFAGDDPSGCLIAVNDLAPFKAYTDVLLVGDAYAPSGSPVRSLVARLAFGPMDKSIEIMCDRSRAPDGAILEGSPFSRMPLVYERAAASHQNPRGVRPDAQDARGYVTLPNLRVLSSRSASVAEGSAFAAFGPISPSWPLRRNKLWRRAGALPADLRGRAVPHDIDPSYFNAAPPDQQIGPLRGDEPVTLENLSPDMPSIKTCFPKLSPHAIVEMRGASQHVPMRCDTVWFDADRQICTLTYRAQILVDHPDMPGRVSVTAETSTPNFASTVPDDSRPNSPALPFTPSVPQSAPVQELASRAPEPTTPAPELVFRAPETSLWASEPVIRAAEPAFYPPSLRDEVARVQPIAEAPPAAAPLKARQDEEDDLAGGPAVALIWFDPDRMLRIRRKSEWSSLFEALEETPLDRDIDDTDGSATPMVAENKRDLAAVIAKAEPLAAEQVSEALRGGARRGVFTPAIELFAGDVSLPFDSLGVLRATVATVTPLAAGDEALRASLEAASDLLQIEGLVCAPAVAEGLTNRIRDVFSKGKRAVAPGYLDAQVERAALEGRLYQKREVHGGVHLRALLHLPRASSPIPLYLPEHLSSKLPMRARFSVKIMAEVHPAVDAFETHEVGLKAVAVAMTIAPSA